MVLSLINLYVIAERSSLVQKLVVQQKDRELITPMKDIKTMLFMNKLI